MEGCQVGKKSESSIKSVRVPLEKLVCEGSYDDLEITLSQTDGVLDLDLDRKQKVVFVDFDPAKITEEQIIDHISRVGCRIQEF